MSRHIPLVPALPMGDGSLRSHRKMRDGLAAIARRVAVHALSGGQTDVLLAVYVAGASHAVALLERRQEAPQ